MVAPEGLGSALLAEEAAGAAGAPAALPGSGGAGEKKALSGLRFFTQGRHGRHRHSSSEASAATSAAARAELGPRGRLFIFVVYTQVVQGLMSYDGGATQFSTAALARSGWSPIWLGLLGAMDKFGQVATAFLWGAVLMTHDAKPLLAYGLFWKAACCLAFGKLQEWDVTLAAQLLMLGAKLGMGVTEALISVWATVWVQRNAPHDARARWLGFAGTSAGIGSGIGSGVASLWNPIYAFFVQAFVLFVIWAGLLFTPAQMFRFGVSSGDGDNEDDEMPQPFPQFPRQMLVQEVVRRVSQCHAHDNIVVVESLHLPGHYLDASVDPLDHGFKVRVTKGDPLDGDWAQFKMCLLSDELASFESVRLPGHFLDASCEAAGFRNRRYKLRLCECEEGDSPASAAWAQFRLHRAGPEQEVFRLESVRVPGHFISATGERLLRGTKVALARESPGERDWARFRLRVTCEDFGDAAPRAFDEKASWAGRLWALLGNHLWLWTALAISLNCFVTSGVAFLWQNTVDSIWGFGNGWSYFLFLLSTGLSGLLGVTVGPQIFDGHLGGFAFPKGKELCLLWCKRLTFVGAVCGTACAALLIFKAGHLVYWNKESVVYWQLAMLVLCIFAIFFIVNAMTGVLYGINSDACSEEVRTFAVGLTVSFQNVFGYACGPLLPSGVAQLVGSCVQRVWPHWPWHRHAVDGAKFAAGMGSALAATWVLFFFARMGYVSARLVHISFRSMTSNFRHLGGVSRRFDSVAPAGAALGDSPELSSADGSPSSRNQ